MSLGTDTLPPGALADDLPCPLSAEMFFRMIDAGLIAPERRVYLWDGRLLEKMAKSVAHATTHVRILEILRPRLPDGWLLWPENPLQLDPGHAPLPDVSVIRGPLERYDLKRRHPGPADTGLVVEISVRSLADDLNARAEKFARALVPNYWVVDANGRRIVEHRGPEVHDGVGRYRHVLPHEPGDSIPLALDGREVARILVAEIFP